MNTTFNVTLQSDIALLEAAIQDPNVTVCANPGSVYYAKVLELVKDITASLPVREATQRLITDPSEIELLNKEKAQLANKEQLTVTPILKEEPIMKATNENVTVVSVTPVVAQAPINPEETVILGLEQQPAPVQEVYETVGAVQQPKEATPMNNTPEVNREVLEEVIATQQATDIIKESKIEDVVKIVEEHGTDFAKEALGKAVDSGDLDRIKKAGMTALMSTSAVAKAKGPELMKAVMSVGQSFSKGINSAFRMLAKVGGTVLKLVVGAVKWIWKSAYSILSGLVHFTIDVVKSLGRGLAHVGITAIESAKAQVSKAVAK